MPYFQCYFIVDDRDFSARSEIFPSFSSRSYIFEKHVHRDRDEKGKRKKKKRRKKEKEKENMIQLTRFSRIAVDLNGKKDV